MIKKLSFLLLILLYINCASTQTNSESQTSVSNTPHTVNDISRSYEIDIKTVFEACKKALKDIGADYYKPIYKFDEKSARIVASTKTRLYGVIIWRKIDFTEVNLFIEDKSTTGVLKKSIFDEFWEAVQKYIK